MPTELSNKLDKFLSKVLMYCQRLDLCSISTIKYYVIRVGEVC